MASASPRAFSFRNRPKVSRLRGFRPPALSAPGSSLRSVSRTADRIRAYYRNFDEWHRLVQDPYHELEIETTLHFLRRYLPSKGTVLDAGGGPGRYTIELARAGFNVTLLDFTPEVLEQAHRNVRRAGVSDRVREFVLGSVTDLSEFESGSFDAVLCLGGPLNHILRARDREGALDELGRVAKPYAPIFVSVISRYAQLIDGLVRHPDGLRTDPAHHWRILRTGNYDGHRGFAPSHFFAPEELRSLLRKHRLKVIESVGLEGLAAGHIRVVNRLARVDPSAWRSWWSFHLATCGDPAVVATSQHFLVVSRKPSRPS